MKFIGNQVEWINESLMKTLETTDGDAVKLWEPSRWNGHPLLDKIREAGTAWFKDSIPDQHFHIYNSRTPGFSDYKFELPSLIAEQTYMWWWYVKLNPGQMQLMHYDMHTIGVSHKKNDFSEVSETREMKNTKRFTMFLQDWEPGHVFVYNNKMPTDYKKGDIFLWEEPECYHGVANLTYLPRYTLQLTLCD